MAMLYDQGLFQYEDKVTKYWPEFGQEGKGEVRICDVLRHQSGLAWFTKSIPSIKDAWPENIKLNKIGQFIETQKQHYPFYPDGTNTTVEYHGLSRGVIVNEIVRRIDPKVHHWSIPSDF